LAESVELVHGHPAGLAKVLAIGLAANALPHVEAGIGRGIEGNLIPHRYLG
jgi:hypothetical protein